ncbi:MAG: alpha/beta hydrolase [Pseudomonadota bacterium]
MTRAVEDMQTETLQLTIGGRAARIALLRRKGGRAPLVCLHGFGSTKDDYADLALRADFDGRDLAFIDAPGCGGSTLDDPEALSIPFLADAAVAVCDALGFERFHLSGHSMGGLTGLMLAHAHPRRVLSFIDIEGNLAPEDCFLSRQIVEHPAADGDAFLAGFIERVSRRPEYGSRLYAAALPLKVRPAAIRPIFTSMVALSDETPLLEIMAGLPCPRMFVYGEQNRRLSYLDSLPSLGVEVAEIPFSGHFPMYSNPPALWSAMAGFLSRSEAAA